MTTSKSQRKGWRRKGTPGTQFFFFLIKDETLSSMLSLHQTSSIFLARPSAMPSPRPSIFIKGKAGCLDWLRPIVIYVLTLDTLPPEQNQHSVHKEKWLVRWQPTVSVYPNLQGPYELPSTYPCTFSDTLLYSDLLLQPYGTTHTLQNGPLPPAWNNPFPWIILWILILLGKFNWNVTGFVKIFPDPPKQDQSPLTFPGPEGAWYIVVAQ